MIDISATMKQRAGAILLGPRFFVIAAEGEDLFEEDQSELINHQERRRPFP